MENETCKDRKPWNYFKEAYLLINNFLLILSLCGFVLGIMACSVLWFSNKTHRHANHLLSLSLFGLSMAMLVTFLSAWNIDIYAYIYRFPGPLYYLIMPGAYLYLRAVVFDETKLRKWDFIHFLPAVFRFIEMVPFYFTSYEYRRSLARKLLEDPDKLIKLDEGILPPYFHTVLLFALGLIYLSAMFLTLKKVKGVKAMKFPISHTRAFRWLQAFTALIALISIPMIVMVAISQPQFINRTQFLLITVSICFLVINLFLFFQPEILYGIPRMKLNGNNPPPIITNREEITPDQTENALVNQSDNVLVEKEPVPEENEEVHSALSHLDVYKPVLELYIASAKPFLKQGYTILDLSRDTGIPQHHLSALLNRVYQMRFNEFMNRMRIDYITENFGTAEWDNLTLEGIAKQAGFNSRTTFFNSIKKTTGLAPSEFMENIKSSKETTKDEKESN